MRRLLLPLAALLITAACATTSSSGGGARLKAGDYHPLAVGAAWTYAGKVGGQAVEKTITITGKKDGYFADDAGGLLRVDAEGLRDEKRYLLRNPLEKGKSWTSIVSVSSTEHYEIVDLGFTINTPAGQFNDCVLVRGTNRIDANKSLRNEWTFAPKVGMVRIAGTLVDGQREMPQVFLELNSFRAPPPEPASSAEVKPAQ
ncbi:MAG: hypothetical protein QM765_07440 [Myxococcales bacterium]